MISTLIHAAFFIVLCLSVLINLFKKKPEAHVFTLVAPPSITPHPPVSTPPLTAPKVEDLPPSQEHTRELPTPTLTYDTFVKEHGMPKITQPARRPSNRVTVPKIEVSPWQLDLSLSPADSSEGNRTTVRIPPAGQDAIQRYLGMLKDQINRAWQKPTHLSGRQFETTVTFSVASDGRITSLRIIRSSGNELFDTSVRAAFSRVVNAGPTPDGDSYTPTLTFRMSE